MTTDHPDWCQQGHRCAAERGGEHRSAPLPVTAPGGHLVLTITQRPGRAPAAEALVRATLTGGDHAAGTRLLALAERLAGLVREATR